MYTECELLESSQSNQNIMLSVETKHADEVRGLPASVGFNYLETMNLCVRFKEFNQPPHWTDPKQCTKQEEPTVKLEKRRVVNHFNEVKKKTVGWISCGQFLCYYFKISQVIDNAFNLGR